MGFAMGIYNKDDGVYKLLFDSPHTWLHPAVQDTLTILRVIFALFGCQDGLDLFMSEDVLSR